MNIYSLAEFLLTMYRIYNIIKITAKGALFRVRTVDTR